MDRKQRYKDKVASGICSYCGKEPVVPQRTRCVYCAENNKQLSKELRANLLCEGKCVRCWKINTNGKAQCDACCVKQAKYRKSNKESGKCSQCDRQALCGKIRCEHHDSLAKKSRKKLRDEVFAAYGGYNCSCCGECTKEFLVIDHINGGGGKQRKELGSGEAIYRWLRKNNFPDGYQVLCCNCNWGKKICGECPHKRQKEKNMSENNDYTARLL